MGDMPLVKAFRRRPTSAAPRVRQPVAQPGLRNVWVASGLILMDHIAQRAVRLAEVEGVTTQDPKSRFGIVRSQSVYHAELVLFISDYFLWAPPTATVTTVIHSHYGP